MYSVHKSCQLLGKACLDVLIFELQSMLVSTDTIQFDRWTSFRGICWMLTSNTLYRQTQLNCSSSCPSQHILYNFSHHFLTIISPKFLITLSQKLFPNSWIFNNRKLKKKLFFYYFTRKINTFECIIGLHSTKCFRSDIH